MGCDQDFFLKIVEFETKIRYINRSQSYHTFA